MKTAIVKTAIARTQALLPLEDDPRFRNTTKNMMLAYLALNQIIGASALPQNETGLFVATGHGELEASVDFLKTLAVAGVARPILFQNSLHNSILGFLTRTFSLTGPSLTLSNRFFSGEDALDTAIGFLKNGRINYALVVGVDSIPRDLAAILPKMYPHELALGEGAAALLLANENALRMLSAKPAEVFYITKLAFQQVRYSCLPYPLKEDGKLATTQLFDIGKPFYDADAIEKIVQHLDEKQFTGELTLHKPDGSSSHLEIEKETLTLE